MGSAITGAGDIRIKYIWGSFSSFATLKACSVLQNEFSLCPCGIPAAQWGMWQVSWEQLVWSSGCNCPLEDGFDLQGFRLLPQCFVSVRGSPSYSDLGLLIKTQALAEAKQLAVSSCSGVHVRCCLTGSISGEEIYILSSVLLPQNICGLGDKWLTSLLWNVPERSQAHLNPDFLLPSVEASVPRGQAEQWLLSRGSKSWIKIELNEMKWNEIAVSLQLWNALIRVHPCTAVLSKAITSAYW